MKRYMVITSEAVSLDLKDASDEYSLSK